MCLGLMLSGMASSLYTPQSVLIFSFLDVEMDKLLLRPKFGRSKKINKEVQMLKRYLIKPFACKAKNLIAEVNKRSKEVQQ